MEILVSEEAGVRYLHFSSDWIQGAMRIARPYALELEYTREMMAALLLRPEPNWPRKVLLIGLGAASLTKFLHRHRPDAKLTIVEIEPAVVAAARQHFRLPDDDARLRIVIGDGADYVADAKTRFDLARAFDGRALCFPSCDSGNAVAFAAAGDAVDFGLSELRSAARRLKKDTGLNLLPTLMRLEGWHRCEGSRLVL